MKKSHTTKKDDRQLFAFIATFLSIIGFIVALLSWRKNEYVMFYAKQSLVIFIMGMIFYIVDKVLGWIPIIGWLIMWVLGIITLVLWLLSWVYALSGKKKIVPIIGQYAEKFKF